MSTRLLPLVAAVCALTNAALAQTYTTYGTGSDFIAWPTDPTAPLRKIVGADVTPDELDDAFALYGDSLYLIHAPAQFPRFELVSNGVTDFTVVQRQFDDGSALGTNVVIYSTELGLSYASWNGSAIDTFLIPGSTDWAYTTRLASQPIDDYIALAGVVNNAPQRLMRSRWLSSGSLGSFMTSNEHATITGLALGEYDDHVDGIECAVIAGGSLRIRTEAGVLNVLPASLAPEAHKVYRNPGGGANGRDSFLYVAASQQSGSLESIQEVFLEGASAPVQTFGLTVRDIATNRPWSHPLFAQYPCVSVQLNGTFHVYRFADVGAAANVTTLIAVPSIEEGEQDYWCVPVSSSNTTSTPVTDGLITYADFDGDDLDDLLVASNSLSHFYVYPARDNIERSNGMQITGSFSKSSSSRRGGGSALLSTYTLNSSVNTGQLQGLSGPPTRIKVWVWVRNGVGATNYVDIPPVTATAAYNPSGPTPISVSVSTNYTAPDLIFYLQYRGQIVDSTTGTVLESSQPANCVAGTVSNDPNLCPLFSAEPDRYTLTNQQQNGCTLGSGPVILGGFNRRSTIGPFPAGYGSPVP
ncbi:MAG: hypothetical protein L6Q99_12450 [Planctomycetes bacterium]|nr:hypothetical protein [Planctomycetota bacterium]